MPNPTLMGYDPEEDATPTAEEQAGAKKLFAEARGAVAVDENGQPVRRYLSDPPSEYRVPDPTAPVDDRRQAEEEEVQVVVAAD